MSNTFKVGDKVRFKDSTTYLNTGKIYEISQVEKNWITLNNILIADPNDLVLDTDNSNQYQPVPCKCTCGSSSVGSDRHSDYCDLYVRRT